MPFSGLTAILNDVWDALTHALRVEPVGGGSFPVSGTVTANQGTAGAQAWPISLPDMVSVVNSTTTPLAANATFTGTGEDVSAYQSVSVNIFSDVGSLTNGIQLQFSPDNTHWDTVLSLTNFHALSQGLPVYAPVSAQFFRVVYINAGTAQTVFRLQTLYHSGPAPVGTSTLATYQTGQRLVTLLGWPDASGNLLTMPIVTPNADGLAQNGLFVIAGQYVYPGSGTTFNRVRTPAVFKDAQANAAGSTALWTPATGKKVRLMRYMVQVTGDAALAMAGELTIRLLDNATGIGQRHILNLPAAAGTGPTLYVSSWIDLGNGILSSAANNVLNINLSAALTSGLVGVICCGTEE